MAGAVTVDFIEWGTVTASYYYDSSEDLSNQVTCAATNHLLCETNESQYKLRVIFLNF